MKWEKWWWEAGVVVPLYLWGTHFQIPSGCLKLWVRQNSTVFPVPTTKLALEARLIKRITRIANNDTGRL
jgi:hypothetical protein